MAGFCNTRLYSPTRPILLRNPEERDATTLMRILSDPANTKYDPHTGPSLTIEQSKAMIEAMRKSAEEEVPTRVNMVVVRLPTVKAVEELEVIGLSGFGGIDEFERKEGKVRFADVGAMLDERFRGQGFAVESIRLSVGFAFNNLKVDGVSCQMSAKNEPMIGLIDNKFGWTRVSGSSKSAFESGDIRYELGPEEWAAWEKKREQS
ncbi:GNAT domain-containing protein [Bisporella sp. PMI_857]|nr:GNAT domain-containing protein [Bisporella sp. PMI_857]